MKDLPFVEFDLYKIEQHMAKMTRSRITIAMLKTVLLRIYLYKSTAIKATNTIIPILECVQKRRQIEINEKLIFQILRNISFSFCKIRLSFLNLKVSGYKRHIVTAKHDGLLYGPSAPYSKRRIGRTEISCITVHVRNRMPNPAE